ncbi:MAG: ABC transporter substrate-binding protein [Deltaproteobacteria bacterium]|nr:ABC transporter substrate-binding protein [Deltaproteobacteria bacterium]
MVCSSSLVRLSLTLLLLTGCERKASQPRRALVIAQPRAVESLDPPRNTTAEGAQVVSLLYEPLIRIDGASGRVMPGLAARWSVAPDGRTWTFHLRRGVRFHDGSPFDAKAVVYTIDRLRNSRHPHYHQGYAAWQNIVRNITAIEETGRFTLRLVTKRPFAPFLRNLAIFPLGIVKAQPLDRAISKTVALTPVGTGPYRISSHQRDEVILTRNPHYWGPKANVERLVFRAIKERRQRMLGLQSGTLDVAFGLAPADRPIVQLHPELRLQRGRGDNVAYLAMNTRRAPFDDVRVRRAINHAVDKGLIVKLGFQGLATVAHGALPPSVWAYTSKIKRYSYDPARARRLLGSVGYDPERPLRLYVMSTPRPYFPSPVLVARIIARNLARVGIPITLVVKSHAEHLAAVGRGEHDLCLLGWVGDNGDPDNFLYMLLDRDNARIGSAQNVAFFDHSKVHELLIAARQELNRAQRKELYLRAQQLIAEEAPWVPLAHSEYDVGVRHDIRGLSLSANGIIDFARARF